MLNVEFESDAKESAEKSAEVQKATLAQIQNKCQELVDLDYEISELTSKLSIKQAEARVLSEKTIPDMMDGVGIKMLKLANDKKLEVVPVVAGAISRGKPEEAFKWLREHDFGDLIKRNVSIEFGRGEDEKASELKKRIEELGFTPKDKSDVHHMTLTAWAKEQLAKGTAIPLETLGIWIGRKTKIT
jgi:hypothetical protein